MGRVLLSGLSAAQVHDLYRDEPGTGEKSPSAFAAFIDQLAADAAAGFVVQNSGYEPGVASIAAPIRDITGHVVAAVNISAVALLTNDAELNGPLKAEVLAVADAISRDLGHQAKPDATGNDTLPARRTTQ
jgi:IclR family pca regulon transcriptional regulator